MKIYDIELEKNVLAVLLLDDDIEDKVLKLTEEDFYATENKQVFVAIKTLLEQKENVDIVSVSAFMKDRNQNAGYIKKILEDAETVDFDEAVAVLKEKTKIRQLINAGQELIKLAKEDMELEKKLNIAQEIFNAFENRNYANIKSMKEIVMDTLKILEERYKNKGQTVGLDTGFVDLNNATGGLRNGELITIAGRPAMGKSAFALDIAMNVASKGNTVLYFSLEMSKEQLGERAFIQWGTKPYIDGYQLRTGLISDETWKKIGIQVAQLAKLPLYICDDTDLNIYQLRSICRDFKKTHDLKLVIVDYLQLMEGGNDSSYENRQNEIAKISRNLKKLARELNIPVIALSQLNREVEKRQNKRPMLSDLRESGSIEQDSDMVWLLYRDEYYHPDTKEAGVAEVIIAKQRSGPTGTIKLAFLKDYITFRNLAKRE